MENLYQTIWPNLSNATITELDRAAVSIELKRGEHVYEQGERPRGMYFIENGLVGLVLIGASSGKEHLVRFFRTGQFFGHRALFANEGYHGTTTALEPTKIRMIPRQTILNVLEKNPQLYQEILIVVSKELRRSELQHIMILENHILSRTAQALVYLKELHPDHKWTRLEIANFCASTVSTIIKAMAELESMGFIQQDGRDIKILKRDELVALQDHDGSFFCG